MIRDTGSNARHQLTLKTHGLAVCACGWHATRIHPDDALEAWSSHRDDVDEAQRLKAQHLEQLAARAVNSAREERSRFGEMSRIIAADRADDGAA